MMNKKSILYLTIYALISILICTYFIPWYFIVVLLFIGGYFLEVKSWFSFLVGLLIPFTSWVIIAAITNNNYDVSISHLVANILDQSNPLIVYALTGLSIGLVSGFSALSGNLLRKITVSK